MIVAYQVGYLVNIIPVPGGIGVLETGLVGMLGALRGKATPAAAGVLIYHAIALWVPTVFGTVAFLLLRRTLNEPLVLSRCRRQQAAPPAVAAATRAGLIAYRLCDGGGGARTLRGHSCRARTTLISAASTRIRAPR